MSKSDLVWTWLSAPKNDYLLPMIGENRFQEWRLQKTVDNIYHELNVIMSKIPDSEILDIFDLWKLIININIVKWQIIEILSSLRNTIDTQLSDIKSTWIKFEADDLLKLNFRFNDRINYD